MISKENFIKIISNIFWICFGLFIYSQIFDQTIFWFDLNTNPFFSRFLLNLKNIWYWIIILLVSLGSLLIYNNRKSFIDLNFKKQNEIELEQKRKDDFPTKFPILNRIYWIRYIAKIIYIEWYIYSLGLFLIIILGLILKYYISQNVSPENDETYTYMVIEWYNKFKNMWVTPSWEMYDNTHVLFNYFTTYFYNFFYDNWFNKLFALRSFNIVLWSILTLPLYIFIKKITNKNIAFLSVFLTTFNWYLLLTFITARPYVLFTVFSVIGSILLIFWFNDFIKNQKITKISIIYIFWWLLLWLVNFYEWHILWLYHNVFLIIILWFYVLFNTRFEKSIKLLWSWLILGLLFISFLYFFKPTFLEFIIKTFNPVFSSIFVTISYNQFSYFTWFGLLIILLLISYIFIYNNNDYKILAIYLIFWALLFHAYLFWTRLNSFKYLVDYLVILLIIFSIFIFTFNNNKIKAWLLLLVLFTNIYWIIKVYNDDITLIVLYNENSLKEFDLCKNYNVIATDSPGRAYFAYWNNKEIYSLPSFKDSYHVKNDKYLYLDIYSIKDINHLRNIVKKSWPVCFVFSHNMFNESWMFWNKILFDFVMYKWNKLKEKNLYDRPFGTWKYPLTNKNNWVVLVIDNSIFDIKSQY